MATSLAYLLLAAVASPALVEAVPPFRPPPHLTAAFPQGWERDSGPPPPALALRSNDVPFESDALLHCLQSSNIETMTSSLNGSAAYWEAAQSDNLRFHYHPEAIVYPRSAKEVSAAVKCVSAHSPRTAIAARSGGHSFAGHGSGGWDGSLVVDLKHLDSIRYDAKSGTAAVGPSARLGDVVKGLWVSSGQLKRAMPHGTCPPVGVGGHALCGGFGPTSRQWGMTTDNLLEAEVVLADGSIVTASPRQNKELLWGLRGAGSNFGIVTRLTFQTYDASGEWVFTEMRWSPSLKTGADAAKVVHAVQTLATDDSMPRSYGFHVQLQPANRGDPPGGPLALHMRGIWHGGRTEWERQIESKLLSGLKAAGAPEPDAKTITPMSYRAVMEEWDDFGKPGDKLDTLAERLVRNNFLARTRLTKGQKGFSLASLEGMMTPLLERAKESEPTLEEPFMWNVYLEMYGGGGKLGARHRDQDVMGASSLPHRDSLWLIQSAAGTWGRNQLPRKAHDVLDELDEGFARALQKDGIEDSGYACYVDAREDAEEATRRHFDQKTAERLKKLKREVDPRNVFRNPQGIAGTEYIDEGAPELLEAGTSMIHIRPPLAHPLPRGVRARRAV